MGQGLQDLQPQLCIRNLPQFQINIGLGGCAYSDQQVVVNGHRQPAGFADGFKRSFMIPPGRQDHSLQTQPLREDHFQG